MPHLPFTMLTALLLSAALALLDNLTFRERLYVAARTFLWCGIATTGGAWAMYLIHG